MIDVSKFGPIRQHSQLEELIMVSDAVKEALETWNGFLQNTDTDVEIVKEQTENLKALFYYLDRCKEV